MYQKDEGRSRCLVRIFGYNTLVFLFLGVTELSAKPLPGLYLVAEGKSLCPNQVMMTEGSTYCLEKSPLLNISEFLGIGDIYVTGGAERIRNMDIVFTQEGVRIFKALIKAFPHGKLALVVGGKIVSIIKVDGVRNVDKLVIWDHYDSSFEAIHKKIKKAIKRSDRKNRKRKEPD